VSPRSCPSPVSRLVRRARAGRHALLPVLLFALCVRALVPAGYMVGSAADGWPVVLCPEGLPAGFLTVSAPRASADDAPGMSHHHGAAAADEPAAHAPPGSDPVREPLDPTAPHGEHAGPGSDTVAQHCPWGGALDKAALAFADAAPAPRAASSLRLHRLRPTPAPAGRRRGPAVPRAPPVS
jgi:hypothetical protein